MRSDAAPRLSVIIPTRNRAPFLRLTLACLASQTMPSRDYEVIVVDDGSTDDTPQVVGSFLKRLPLRRLAIQAGSAGAARNAGARGASGAILLFIDDECLTRRSFLESHLRAHQRARRPAVVRGPTSPVLSFWGKPVFGNLAASRAPLSRVKALGWLLDPAEIMARGFEPLFPLASRRRFYDEALRSFGDDLSRCPAPWPLFLTRNVSVARKLWDAAGEFDESLPAAGLEDMELGYRLHKLGAPFLLEPSADSYWQHCAVDKKRKARRLAGHYRLICAKHDDMGVLLIWKLLTGGLDFAAFNRRLAGFRDMEMNHPREAARRRRLAAAAAKRYGQDADYLLRHI